jgi:tetratricopeptide (TPR) repeat protein
MGFSGTTIYWKIGEKQNALLDFLAAAREERADVDFRALSLNQLGAFQRELGDNAAAVESFGRTIALSIAHSEVRLTALWGRALAHAALGQNEKGIEDCSAVLGIPGLALAVRKRVLGLRYELYLKTGNKTAAKADEEAILAIP